MGLKRAYNLYGRTSHRLKGDHQGRMDQQATVKLTKCFYIRCHKLHDSMAI